jgi:hypothetical protein
MAAPDASSPSGIPETFFGVWHQTLEIPPTVATLNFALNAAINADIQQEVPQRFGCSYPSRAVVRVERVCPWLGCRAIVTSLRHHIDVCHGGKCPNTIVSTFLASSFLMYT